MDLSGFERRLEELMDQVGAADWHAGGAEKILLTIEALEADLAASFNGVEASAETASMLDSLAILKAVVSGPETAGSDLSETYGSFELNPKLYEAVEDGDIETVRELLKTEDVNQTFGQFAKTPLYHAMSCSFGVSLEMVTFLLDAGADPKKGLADTNVLHGLGFAVMNDVAAGDLAAVVKRCVDLGADIEQRSDKLRWTPLITAASEWNEVAVEALLLAGADVNAMAGDVDGVFGAGADSRVFASGHKETLAVLDRFHALGKG